MTAAAVGAEAPISGGRLTRGQRARAVGNWLNLTTPFGLLVSRTGGARLIRGPRGLFLAEGYRLRFPIAAAFTIGNVVITSQQWDELLAQQPRLLRHEERHSWQYLACGLAFFPLYGLAIGWSYATTRSIGRGNIFERMAGLADGGYL